MHDKFEYYHSLINPDWVFYNNNNKVARKSYTIHGAPVRCLYWKNIIKNI